MSCTYVFDYNMATYIVSKVLYCDDYSIINQIAIKPIECINIAENERIRTQGRAVSENICIK